MNKNIIFCIVDTPFSIEEHEYTIIFTKKGDINIDHKIREEYDFSSITNILEKKGYIEIEDLKFEYTGQNYVKNKPTKKDLITSLEMIGVSYGKDFESNMIQEIKKISNLINPEAIKKIFETSFNIEGNSLEKTMKFIEENSQNPEVKEPKKRKTTILPSIGKEIELSFYLLFDFVYNDSIKDFLIDLNGAFSLDTKAEKRYRNLIRIVTEKFERFDNGDVNNNRTMFFKSKKTKEDFLNEISFLHEVVVDLIVKSNNKGENKMVFDKREFYFDIFDIKNKINNSENIIISLDITDYENMLILSDKIKKEKIKQKQKTVNIEEVKIACKEVENSLTYRMLKSADEDNFKEAASLKKNIQIVKNKIKNFKSNYKRGNLSLEDYHDFFNLS